MSTASGERRLRLAESRKPLFSLPMYELFELPGRPHVVYMLRSYADTPNAEEAAQTARNDIPFLFKAFETGQIGPKRMAKMHGGKPRTSTIHEYLDWTVTAQAAQEDDELDFGGFRILALLPRYVSHWPIPDHPGNKEGKRTYDKLGAYLPPMPMLQTHGKPLSAATIRSGPGYLEIPFVATHEGKRGRGYCRCLLEAMEDIARSLGLPKLLLCSTNDPIVKSTWYHLGFEFTTEQQMEEWDTPHSDLVYLQNTTQMHKDVPGMGIYRPVKIKHGLFEQRSYARLDKQPKRPKLHVPPPKKAPPKKVTNMTSQPSLSNPGRPLLLLPAPSPSLANSNLATSMNGNDPGSDSQSMMVGIPQKGHGKPADVMSRSHLNVTPASHPNANPNPGMHDSAGAGAIKQEQDVPMLPSNGAMQEASPLPHQQLTSLQMEDTGASSRTMTPMPGQREHTPAPTCAPTANLGVGNHASVEQAQGALKQAGEHIAPSISALDQKQIEQHDLQQLQLQQKQPISKQLQQRHHASNATWHERQSSPAKPNDHLQHSHGSNAGLLAKNTQHIADDDPITAVGAPESTANCNVTVTNNTNANGVQHHDHQASGDKAVTGESDLDRQVAALGFTGLKL